MLDDNHPENRVTIILNTLKDIASSVMDAAGAGTVEQVLERIAHVSRDLVNARYSALGVPDESGGLKFFKVAGMTPEQVEHLGHLPHGRGLLGALMEERHPLRLADMTQDSRSSGFCPGHPRMTSLLGVPIQVGSRLFGILYLCDRADGLPFSEQDEWLVETLAGYAALAIAGAELSEQHSLLTILEERERIGMELHDGVIQSLYAIGMQIDLLRMDGQVKPEDLRVTITNLNGVIDDIRQYILNLKSPSDHTIYTSLNELVSKLHIPRSLTIDIHAPDLPPPFTPAIFESICQIANEVLSNAVRHAQATHIDITARQDQYLFQIIISDNGLGFDLGGVKHGLGLTNIQQRARLHGGQVRIDSTPNTGTRVTISVPTRPI